LSRSAPGQVLKGTVGAVDLAVCLPEKLVSRKRRPTDGGRCLDCGAEHHPRPVPTAPAHRNREERYAGQVDQYRQHRADQADPRSEAQGFPV